MQDKAGISSSWILLDSQSTVDVFSNPKLLSNIRDARRSLTLYCNAGKAIITKKGDLKGYGTVWYHPDGIANILSLHNIQKKYKVTYDSAQGDGFVVHKENGNNRVFMPSNKGLFYSDVKNDTAHVLINTVDKNKNKHTVKQYSNARKARSLQDIIGCPSTADYIKYVEQGLIPNCPITKEDIICAEDILGPNLGSLKGKTTRKTPDRVTLHALENLPSELLSEHRNVTIMVDIMYINGIPFIMTTSRAIHFGTAEMIKNETKSTIIKSLQQIINTYHGRGFEIKHILGDWQFECIRAHMEQQGINLNITGRDEHIPEIERFIRTVKERTRAIVNTLPFEILPHRLIVEIVYNVMFWLNCFPHKDGIHATLSPRTIVTGSNVNYDKHCKLQFGTYVQVHEQHNNSMAT